jgi:hypothetical protein
MKIRSDWKSYAVCASDKHHYKWLSYKESDVEYAKEGCSRCEVKKECLATALVNNSFVGVIAGMSEYDLLMNTWQEAGENESNWRTDDRTFQKLLQEAE